MNKSDLVTKMAKLSGLTKKDSQAALSVILQVTKKRLSEGDQMQISGLGTFSLSYHPAKQGRNPQTGETITIEGQNKILFKPAKILKSQIQ
ncbi:HU family DNA-binding protein [Pseudoalteromonas sp. SCSIO 43201]|uniref:HU family DNA-binding protein n=1 Tax=Pseudoalteromonas TaxID=53246 RepID=UPI0020753F2E|nr:MULTISPECIES: HU family DNA-binding protein [Pseudoalteromonas]MDW7549910.1 HU family DNA-binding protein [Pseudoalteromonas peptidolytica]USD29755.1 HU family DNA-binding protein [Pseudoalteromonas sp. SCSIO 43201]